MFSSVLNCPECNHRFNFEHEAQKFPERITCPECKITRDYRDFSALIFCPRCRIKLQIPLDILFDDDLLCPECNIALNAKTALSDDDDCGSTFDGRNQPQVFKRILQDGEVFDKYRIIRLLGRGGMAEVYLAEHLLLKQLCALKLMRDNHAADDPVYVKRFLREAKLLHRFDHPNIVKVYDAGNDFKTGYFFIAMEYVEGKTLLEIVHEQKLDEEYLKTVLLAMTNALICLNEAKVVHRDIKPSNIMLDTDGVFRLMDLGIAKSESNHPAGEMTLTLEQSTMGTPSYASPEQCHSAHKVDIRSDIYSLGATIYHAASGKLPYDGTTAVEIILKVIQSNAEPLKNLRPDLSPRFLEIVDLMMKKDPAERPASPEALAAMVMLNSGGLGTKIARALGKGAKKVLQWFMPSKELPLSKLIFRAVRIIFAVILLAVIAVNFKYIHNYYQNRQKKQESQPETPTAAISTKYDPWKYSHPMPNYPDSSGELKSRYTLRKGEWQHQFPRLSIAPLPEKSLIVDYDFKTKMPPAETFSPDLISDGVARLKRLVPYSYGEPATRYSARIFLPHLPDEYTLTITFKTPAEEETDTNFFNIGKIALGARRGRVILSHSNYYIWTELKTVPGKWTNITISCDRQKRKIMLFSGNAFLGSYLWPDKKLPSLYMNFSTHHGSKDLQLGYIQLFNKALTLQISGRTPEYISRNFADEKSGALPPEIPLTRNSAAVKTPVSAPARSGNTEPEVKSEPVKTAVTPEPQKTTAVQTLAPEKSSDPLDQQLEQIKSNYRQFIEMSRREEAAEEQKTAKLPRKYRGLFRQITQYRDVLKKEWKERIVYLEKRNKQIKAVREKKYDEKAGYEVQQMFQEYTTRRRDWGYNQSDIEFSRNFQKMLSNEDLDPNLTVIDGTYSSFSGPLFFAVSSGRIHERNKVIQILIDRKADPSVLNQYKRQNNYIASSELTHYGLPDPQLQFVMDLLFTFDNQGKKELPELVKILFFDGAKFKAEHLNNAVLANRAELVSLILAAGFDPNTTDSNGETALFNTYRMPDGSLMRNLLLSAGTDPQIRNFQGKKAGDFAEFAGFYRHWEKNDLAECRKILEKNFDPNSFLSNGSTLLTDACRELNLPAIRMLMEFKADPNLQDKKRSRPLDRLFYNLRYFTSRSQSLKNNTKKIFAAIKILLNNGGDIRNNPSGFGGKQLNILWYFIYRCSTIPGSAELLPDLLAATKNFDDDAYWSSIPNALLYVKHSDWPIEVTAKIYSAIPGNIRKRNIHSGLYSGFRYPESELKSQLTGVNVNSTRLLYAHRVTVSMLQAALYGKQPPQVIKILLEAGADVDYRNNQGKQASDITNDPEILKLLRKYQK